MDLREISEISFFGGAIGWGGAGAGVGAQKCVAEGANGSAASSDARVIRVVKVFRILRVMRVLKLVKFVT